jgi:hypothetical protein
LVPARAPALLINIMSASPEALGQMLLQIRNERAKKSAAKVGAAASHFDKKADAAEHKAASERAAAGDAFAAATAQVCAALVTQLNVLVEKREARVEASRKEAAELQKLGGQLAAALAECGGTVDGLGKSVGAFVRKLEKTEEESAGEFKAEVMNAKAKTMSNVKTTTVRLPPPPCHAPPPPPKTHPTLPSDPPPPHTHASLHSAVSDGENGGEPRVAVGGKRKTLL